MKTELKYLQKTHLFDPLTGARQKYPNLSVLSSPIRYRQDFLKAVRLNLESNRKKCRWLCLTAETSTVGCSNGGCRKEVREFIGRSRKSKAQVTSRPGETVFKTRKYKKGRALAIKLASKN
jgi:hypothetical protein